MGRHLERQPHIFTLNRCKRIGYARPCVGALPCHEWHVLTHNNRRFFVIQRQDAGRGEQIDIGRGGQCLHQCSPLEIAIGIGFTQPNGNPVIQGKAGRIIGS